MNPHLNTVMMAYAEQLDHSKSIISVYEIQHMLTDWLCVGKLSRPHDAMTKIILNDPSVTIADPLTKLLNTWPPHARTEEWTGMTADILAEHQANPDRILDELSGDIDFTAYCMARHESMRTCHKYLDKR